MEDESQGIGTGVNSGQGIIQVGYAADFNFDHMKAQYEIKVEIQRSQP